MNKRIAPICILLINVMLMTTKAYSVDFFVSPYGNDTMPGTIKKPFATIERAQQEARKLKGETVNIFLRGGTYYLSHPIVFTTEDTRSSTHPIRCQAYKNEMPVLSGAIKISGHWTAYRDGIYKVELPGTLLGNRKIDQLYVNSVLQRMARYPDYNPEAKYYNGFTTADDIKQRAQHWKKPAGAYLHGLHPSQWGSVDYIVTGADKDGLKIEGGWQNNRPQGISGNIQFIENVFEELNSLGEWYIDYQTSTLYYMPPQGLDLNKAVVEGSILTSLVEFRGTEHSPVKNITLKGIKLTGTSRTFMDTKEPLLRSDWRIYRGGAVFMEGTENCGILDSDFIDNGGNDIFFSNYNRGSFVKGCKITGSGASAVCFIGDPNAVRSPLFDYWQSLQANQIDTTPGPKTNNYPKSCFVEDCLIYNIGTIEKQSTGVNIDMSEDITVRHCSIYDMPRAGINIDDGCWGGHIIEYCDIFDTVKESGDHGSFNSWGRDRFWHPDYGTMTKTVAEHPDYVLLDVIKPITLRNSRWACRHGWDIDLDDGSSNYHIYNNLCLNGGLKFREGAFRISENNIFVNNTFHPHVWFPNSEDSFCNNIVFKDYQPIGMPQTWGKEINHNFFTDDNSLKHAQSMGQDKDSLSGDPMFISPESGDYRVKTGSPALRTGFKNFPMNKFGVVSSRLKSVARNAIDYINNTAGAGVQRSASTHVWLGATVKTVTDLGERSATGIPEIQGVILLDVPQDSKAYAAGLRKLDVIWTFDKKTVIDFETLERLQKEGSSHGNTLGVYRSQKIVPIVL